MKLGIIGGTGVYEIDGLQDRENIPVSTPFGEPSDSYLHAFMGGQELFFLPRHACGHRLLPSELNHKANIYGFKKLGVDRIISVSAVGSLREDFKPGDVVLANQFFDRTKASDRHTFFGNGLVAHITFADPVCENLRQLLLHAATTVTANDNTFKGIAVHDGGIYVNMEGPAFSTRAESNTYRKLGFDIIGMTCMAEAKLAREAEMCYALLAMVTDYDCWHESNEAVSVELIMKILHANAELSRAIVRQAIPNHPPFEDCPCHHALKCALVTAEHLVPPQTKADLQPIIGKYMDN
ncbi:MAG: S-methyl-5'-thioadenosine phosphorylase [Spartobacteria bacterium]|nr:S-methyl-5'-thioadenosine phosphorylase [Spartobacteria bacterium]